VKYTFALHKIIKKTDSTEFDQLKYGFLPVEYSKFKFGDKDIARKYGYELARKFINSKVFLNILQQNHREFVVMSSPYCFIPTATWSLSNYFVQFLNQHLVDIGYPVVELSKIHRTNTYKEDYGELSAEQRLALISKDGFQIDKAFLEGKFLIMMDDIKITGSHERIIERTFKENNITNDHVFLYFAELSDSAIDPKVENYLNYAFVKNLLFLDKIIKNENFLPNTRVVKYILNYKEEFGFNMFVMYRARKVLANLYHLAIGNGYHLIPDYQKNLQFIKDLLTKEDYLLK